MSEEQKQQLVITHHAKLGPLREELIEKNGVSGTITYRPIQIVDSSGKNIGEVIKAADDDSDIDAKITAAGYVVVEWVTEDTAHLVKKKRSGIGCGWQFLILLMIFIFVTTLNSSDSEPDYDSTLANISCERIVKDILKTPSSAKFSNQSAIGAGREWTSVGTVESQNSFGAMIATRYTCDVTYHEDGTYSGSARLLE